MNDPARYRLEGGPLDGKTVDPPPAILHEAAAAVAERLGVEHTSQPTLGLDEVHGGHYEFAGDRPDVMVWVAASLTS